MDFRAKVRDAYARAHYLTTRRLGSAIVHSDRGIEATVYGWAFGLSKDLASTLDGVDASADARVFEIAKQDGFDEDNVKIDNVITFEGHKYHIKHTENEDGVGAIFKLTGVCTHPSSIGG